MVQEGATSVSGVASALDKVRVQVVEGEVVRFQAPDASVDPSTGQFNANFSAPLQADQELKVFGVSKAGRVSDAATPVEVQPFGFDWGSVRGYFTAGIVLSNNNSQFNVTSANPFLGFNIDKAWLRPSRSFNSIDHGFGERFRFHTYLDSRLTAISQGTSSTTIGSTAMQSSGSSGTPTPSPGNSGSGSSTSSNSNSNPSPNPSTLLTNSQAASLQVGAYVPFVVRNWDYRGRPYSIFVAPIAKVGFYTVTGAGNAAAQAAENNTRRSGTFFPFYGYGLRLGHYREYQTWDGRMDRARAPQQLSYIDVTVARWGNFEYIAPFNFGSGINAACTVPAADPSSSACDVRKRLWRYAFEGLLVVPNTPLVLGLSANLSAQRPRATIPGEIFLTPPDDLRFLFGVRFDAGKFTGLLSKIGGN
jgi:hypothetical protein